VTDPLSDTLGWVTRRSDQAFVHAALSRRDGATPVGQLLNEAFATITR
jgi:hypothetical protein